MSIAAPASVSFHKMHGCGNDFALIDNRELRVPVSAMADWARRICPRALGVGADGLIFLEAAPASLAAPKPDYIWHFFNADGSRAEMCGNASRCAARLALELGLAGPCHVLGTDAGPIRAEVRPDSELVKVQLTPPKDLTLNIPLALAGQEHVIHFVNSGVPHAVLLCPDAAAVDITALGPALRRHEHFAPAGTNANFVQVLDRERLYLRTFERGVEGETLACGTGAVASTIIANALHLTGPNVAVTTSGGETLTVSLEKEAVFLEGKAVKVFSGTLTLASVGLSL